MLAANPAPSTDTIERYRVPPGGITALRLRPGDRIDVVRPARAEVRELTVLASVPGAVPDVSPDAAATVLRGLVVSDDEAGFAAQRILDMAAPWTGTVAPLHHAPWWTELDDSLATFLPTSDLAERPPDVDGQWC